MSVCVYIYIYIYTFTHSQICSDSALTSGLLEFHSGKIELHPVSVTRFPSFRTQTLENLSHYLRKKRFLSNPDPGENLVSGNLVMETGCTPWR